MAARLIELVTGSLEQKKRWREYKARKRRLPGSYRATIEAVERYLLYSGGVAKGDVLVRMLEDLADLIEGAAADGTPVRGLVGDDPVEFAEAFIANYADGQWVDRERQRLSDAIDAAAGDDVERPGEEKE